MTRRAVPAAAALATALASCGSPSGSAPAPTYRSLEGQVARVGPVDIGAPLVAAVAGSRGVDRRAALSSLIEDALAAEGARAALLDRAPGPAWASTVALARRVPLAAARDARAAGPPTDDELASVTVVHAVVLRTHAFSLDPARGAAAAKTIADAVAGARDADDFQARAAAASAGIRTSIEKLAPFDASGRMVDGNAVDPDFVAAAFALRAPGQTSPVVETSFGWHVIRLVAREAPPAADLDARRARVEPGIDDLRARMRVAELLRARRSRTPVEVSPAADELLSRADAKP